MLQYFLKRSLHSLAVCVCCFLFNIITLETRVMTYAESNDRWKNVKEWTGTLTLEAEGAGSSFYVTVSEKATLVANFNLSDAGLIGAVEGDVIGWGTIGVATDQVETQDAYHTCTYTVNGAQAELTLYPPSARKSMYGMDLRWIGIEESTCSPYVNVWRFPSRTCYIDCEAYIYISAFPPEGGLILNLLRN